jgi:hypothetical protein
MQSVHLHTSTYVSILHVGIRRHTSAYVGIRQQRENVCSRGVSTRFINTPTMAAYVNLRQHTSAYCIHQHTSVNVSREGGRERKSTRFTNAPTMAAYASILHTSANASIRQHRNRESTRFTNAPTIAAQSKRTTSCFAFSASVNSNERSSIRHLNTSAHVSIRQHTSAYVSIRQHTYSERE